MPELLRSSNPSLSLLGVLALITLRGVCGYGWTNPEFDGAQVFTFQSYMIGSSLLLEWTTDFAVEYVLLYANDGNPNSYEVVLNNKTTSTFGTSYNWTVTTTLPLLDGFHFILYNDTLEAAFLNDFATVPFNITQNVVEPRSSTLPTSTV